MDTFEAFVQDLGITPNRKHKSAVLPATQPAPYKVEGGTGQVTNPVGLILAPDAGLGYLLNLAIYLGLQGGQLVIDGSNRFDLHYVAYGFRRFTPSWEQAARRTHIVRAFTCYEMVKALEQVPPEPQPLLVIDLLAAFYDEAVTDRQSVLLTQKALGQIKRIKTQRPAIISLSPPPADQPSRKGLNSLVREAVDAIYVEPQRPEIEKQLSFLG